jgi:hypothetical protein
MGSQRSNTFKVEVLEPRALLAFVADLQHVAALPGDPASAVIRVNFIDNGSAAIVSGTLSNISNPSAVVLRLPSTSATSQPVTTTTVTTPTSPSAPSVTATVQTVTTSTDAQTVAVLLKPGSGSGPFLHVPFKVTISRASLIGQLTGAPFRRLLTDMRNGLVSAFVTTNNGVDPSTDVAPGNAQNGEIFGTFRSAGPGPRVSSLVHSIEQGVVAALTNHAS